MKRGLTHKIDSLKGLNLPADRYTHKLDSVKQLSSTRYIQLAQGKADGIERKVNKPIDDLESKINKPIDNVESKVNNKLSEMRKEGGENANLPQGLNESVKLPDANVNTSLNSSSSPSVPGLDLKAKNPLDKIDNPGEGKMSELGDAKSKVNEATAKISDIKDKPQQQVDKLKQAGEFKDAQENLSKGNEITDKAQAYSKDAKSIASGDLGEVKTVSKDAEAKIKNSSEIKELEKQNSEVAKYKDMVSKGNDPEAMKKMAQQQVVTYATDHFKGKEDALKQAMDKMSKLKEKYSEMPTMEQMTKRVRNAMHGKPLVERIVPGMTMQIQKWGNFQVDFNPNVSYRISGVWNAGLGWNERVSFSKWNKTVPADRIFGPRVFTSVIIKKGFGVKAEIEKMNSWVPQTVVNPDGGRRAWVWSLFVGIKKEYNFSKTIRGNFQTLYNIYDDHDSSPYADKLVVRIGFEFPMKKKKKS
jgi:hypothetical protein